MTSANETALQIYRDAVHWLQLAADESSKPENMDTAKLLACHECARKLVQKLVSIEENPVRMCGLGQLIVCLEQHQKLLQEKLPLSNSAQSHLKKLSAVDSMLVDPKAMKLDDCIGLEETKQLLREAVLLPHSHSHLFTGKRKPWRSILLYGPPGTGKTLLAHAVAAESQASFYSISSADILSSWVGESEKLIRDLFSHAQEQMTHPVIIHIDEVDSLCRTRSMKEEDHTRRIKTELLKQIDTLGNSNIFLLCATNCPWELDQAFLRRFQRKIFVGLPNRDGRHQLLRQHLGHSGVSIGDEDLKMLADYTEGYSGSDIANVTSEALLRPLRELESSHYWCCASGDLYQPCSSETPGAIQMKFTNLLPEQVCTRDVVVGDVLASLEVCGSTVSIKELTRYEDFCTNKQLLPTNNVQSK